MNMLTTVSISGLKIRKFVELSSPEYTKGVSSPFLSIDNTWVYSFLLPYHGKEK